MYMEVALWLLSRFCVTCINWFWKCYIWWSTILIETEADTCIHVGPGMEQTWIKKKIWKLTNATGAPLDN
jgi:hypothetical protein